MAVVDVASVKFTPDLSELRRELDAELKNIKAEVVVNVRADTKRGIAEIEAFLRRESGKTIQAKVDVDTTGALAQMKAFSIAAGKLATVSPKFGLEKTLGAAQALGPVMAKIGAAALASAASSALIQPALAGAAGAAALIPAALIGGIGAMAAIKLGADGAKKAFEGLKPTIDTLKSQVGASFQSSLAPAVDNLKKALPQLHVGLQAIATAMGGVATKATQVLAFGPNAAKVNGIFVEMSKVIQNVGNAVKPVLQGFINIGAIAAPMLSQLTTGIGATAQKFSAWTASAQGAATIKNVITGMADAFRQVGAILVQVGGIAQAVFTGMSQGGAGLGAVVLPLLANINAALSSTAGQAALGALGAAFATVGQVLAQTVVPVLNAILPVLPQVAGAFASLAQAMGPVLVSAVQALAPAIGPIAGILSTTLASAINSLAPLFPPIVSALSALVQAAAPLLPVLVQIATAALMPLLGALTPLVPVLGQVAQALGQALLAAVRALTPILPVISSAITAILAAVQPLIPVIGGLFAQAIRLLVPIVTQLVQALVPVVQALIPPLMSMVPVLSQYISTLAGFWSQLIAAILPILPPITQLIASLLPPLLQLFQAVMGAIQPLLQAFISLVQAIVPILPPIVQLVGALLPPLIQLFTAVVAPLIQFAGVLIGSVVSAISSVIKWVTDLFSSFAKAGGVLDTVKGWFRDAWEFIKSVWSGVGKFFGGIWDGITAGLKGALNFAIKLLNGLISAANHIPWVNIPQIPYLERGGTATAGMPHIVGENGPELFVPGQTGRVVDNRNTMDAIGSGGRGADYGDLVAAFREAIAGMRFSIDSSGQARITSVGYGQNLNR